MEAWQGGARRGRDRVLVAALCAYFALVGVAAWPEPVRPAALDALHAGANRALQAVSIMPGHKVFAIPEHVDETAVVHCVHVRGFGGQQPPRDLWPPDGECLRGGVRFRAPAVSIYFDRTLRRAGMLLGSPQSEVDLAHTIASIGRAFCGRGEDGRPEHERVGLLWLHGIRSYETGAQREDAALAFSWSCAEQRIRFAQWFPPQPVVDAFWGAR